MTQIRRNSKQKDSEEKRISMTVCLKKQAYDRLTAEAENAHIPRATYCARLLEDGEYTINLRPPAEMEVLREIATGVSEIQKSDREVIRQLRLTGQASDSLEQAFNRKTARLDHLIGRLEN